MELFWLDVLELGIVVSPNASLSFLLLFPIAQHFRLYEPDILLLPLLLALLSASTAALLERTLRMRQNKLLDSVERWCAGDSLAISPAQAVWRIFLQRSALQFILFCSCYTILFWLTDILSANDSLPHIESLRWHMLFAIAAAGAMLTLRSRFTIVVLTISLLALIFWQGVYSPI